eukprot:c1024_g1_i1.p1 GENE.c1024_g1_i1~~c1024_g1_i1.p1  ORF type:complete len:297 (+),score=62.28 c1024_g1_i1:3-893(+)
MRPSLLLWGTCLLIASRCVQGLQLLHIITICSPSLNLYPDLLRMEQTLRHVPNLHWVVVEPKETTSEPIKQLLLKSKIFKTTHIPSHSINTGELVDAALDVVLSEASSKSDLHHVLHIATSTNVVYDLRLFEDMRSTQQVSVWPVGYVDHLRFAGPVCENKQVTNWRHANTQQEEAIHDFPHYLIGTAFSVDYLLAQPHTLQTLRLSLKASAPWSKQREYDLLQIVSNSNMKVLEPKAEGCSQVWLWLVENVEPQIRCNNFAQKHKQNLNKLGGQRRTIHTNTAQPIFFKQILTTS